MRDDGAGDGYRGAGPGGTAVNIFIFVRAGAWAWVEALHPTNDTGLLSLAPTGHPLLPARTALANLSRVFVLKAHTEESGGGGG